MPDGKVTWYINSSDGFLYKGNSMLHIKMRDLEIRREYRVRNGGHSWGYWRDSLFDGLKFISEKFHR
jgi:enterochelin esterase-like enzyme